MEWSTVNCVGISAEENAQHRDTDTYIGSLGSIKPVLYDLYKICQE